MLFGLNFSTALSTSWAVKRYVIDEDGDILNQDFAYPREH